MKREKNPSTVALEEPVSSASTPQPIAVSVVVPAYNEEAAIGPLIEQLLRVMEECGRPHEIIIVDDGSTDHTATVVQRYPVRLIQNVRNRGYGAALKAGIAVAEHDWILTIDADGTYPVQAIPALLAHTPDNDMVVAARVGKSVHVPFVRRPSKWILRWLASYLAAQPIPDLNSGLRVFRKSLAKQFEYLLPSGFSFSTTITLALLCNDYRVFYHPVDYHKRVGHSKVRAIDAYNFLLVILRTVVFFNPLRVFLPLGAGLFLAGSAKFVYDIFLWNLSESAVMFLLAALLVWSVGLLADQISRTASASRMK